MLVKQPLRKIKHLEQEDPDQWNRFKLILDKYLGIGNVQAYEMRRVKNLPDDIVPQHNKLSKKTFQKGRRIENWNLFSKVDWLLL